MTNLRKLEKQAKAVTRCEGCNMPIRQYQGTGYWYSSSEENEYDVICDRAGFHAPKGK